MIDVNKENSYIKRDFQGQKKTKISKGYELICPVKSIDTDMIVRRANGTP